MERPGIASAHGAPSLLDRLAERIYARSGRPVFAAIAVVALVNTTIATAAGVLTAIPHLDLSSGQATRIAVTAGAMSLLGILVTLWAIRRWFAPLASWAVAKSPETARAAWTDAVQFTPRVLRIGVLVFSVAFIPVTVLVTIETGIPIYGAPFVFAYVEFAIMFAAILDYFAFERLLLPMFKDIARFMPTDFVPDFRAPPLRLRIFIVITLVSIFTAIAVSAVEPEGASVTTKLVVALTVPTIVSLTLGLAPLLFLAQSVVGPIGRLQEAVGRVEASDLSVQAPVLGADEVGHLTGSFNRMVRGLRERAALHSAMGAYIDPAIAERVMAEGSSISGEAAEVTVMFVDIVGYTTLAEDAPPEKVVANLNEFFEIVIPLIVSKGGHANKLLGDGLMAVFGVPEPVTDHADQALAASRGIQAKLHDRYAGSLRAGIGLNSGTVVVGSMGGGPKLDYTIIGDVVNVAARVEAFTRETGDAILLTSATRTLLTSKADLVSKGRHSLKGRSAPVELWAA